MPEPLLYRRPDANVPYSVLRSGEDFGYKVVDLVAPPRRLWADKETTEGLVDAGVDVRRVEAIKSPAELIHALPEGDNWSAMTRRTLARLQAFFLILEDPQRRLDVRPVETLAHQVSLVRHILENDRLRRVMIADEVGLGKTIEAGLILQELYTQRPALRVLYLAPARLVTNVRRELDKMDLRFRQWTAAEADARLNDPRIIASTHRAIFADNFDRVVQTPPWDVIIVDECHHLSAWTPDGSDARRAYRLVKQLVERQSPGSRVIFMSGTPHQGHQTRFKNLLQLLKEPGEKDDDLAGRVIYRTKDDIKDWDGNPVFPNRDVRPPLVVDLGPEHRAWLEHIYDYYKPPTQTSGDEDNRQRAAGWRCAQAMQWATSSVQAGLGFLIRQAIRAGWARTNPALREAIAAIRPYRLGPADEDVTKLYERIAKEIRQQEQNADVDDIESYEGTPGDARAGLEQVLREGVRLIHKAGDEKLELIYSKLLAPAGEEKVVLFAQPIETVTALARFLQRKTGTPPALILGGQSDADREAQVAAFRRPDGPQYMVSSRAGGEGINLQVARRLVHIDVPWNPMDMEQRVGRVHRFGSRQVVIVDTVVVKDSREWHAYEVARRKLSVIAATMVEKDRFELMFSRVMALLPQEEFTDVLINNFATPLDEEDQHRLQELVNQGFEKWRDFHTKYGKQQREIRLLDAGQAHWTDVEAFLIEYGGARRASGYTRQKFAIDDKQVKSLSEEAVVLRLESGEELVCGDHGENLVYARDGALAKRLGLNHPEVTELLRRAAFPRGNTGAANVNWPRSEKLPEGVSSLPFAIAAFARQTIQQESNGAWAEKRASLHIFILDDKCRELDGAEKARVLRTLFRAPVKKGGIVVSPSLIQEQSARVAQDLRRPSEAEMLAQTRHAVTPLGVVTVSAE